MEMDREPAPQHRGEWRVQDVTAGNMHLATLTQGIRRSYHYGCCKKSPLLTQTPSKSKDPVYSRLSSKYCGIGGLAMTLLCTSEEKLADRRDGRVSVTRAQEWPAALLPESSFCLLCFLWLKRVSLD